MTARLASLLQRLQPAGVILFARNIQTPEQTWRLLRECQKCVETPLFTCIDLEGGTVDRLRDALGAAPAAAEVFSVDDLRLFRRHGRIIGENCRALGFNVDFAPVLDLAFEASRAVMEASVPAKGRYGTGQLVFERVIQQAEPASGIRPSWQMRIVENGQLNAYASPDGTVYVESGLASIAGQSTGLWAAILTHGAGTQSDHHDQ